MLNLPLFPAGMSGRFGGSRSTILRSASFEHFEIRHPGLPRRKDSN
jgi:hypothetical protein